MWNPLRVVISDKLLTGAVVARAGKRRQLKERKLLALNMQLQLLPILTMRNTLKITSESWKEKVKRKKAECNGIYLHSNHGIGMRHGPLQDHFLTSDCSVGISMR